MNRDQYGFSAAAELLRRAWNDIERAEGERGRREMIPMTYDGYTTIMVERGIDREVRYVIDEVKMLQGLVSNGSVSSIEASAILEDLRTYIGQFDRYYLRQGVYGILMKYEDRLLSCWLGWKKRPDHHKRNRARIEKEEKAKKSKEK